MYTSKEFNQKNYPLQKIIPFNEQYISRNIFDHITKACTFPPIAIEEIKIVLNHKLNFLLTTRPANQSLFFLHNQNLSDIYKIFHVQPFVLFVKMSLYLAVKYLIL